jgi:hypothetical protein
VAAPETRDSLLEDQPCGNWNNWLVRTRNNPGAPPDDAKDAKLSGLVDIALAIAARRRHTLAQLKGALEAGNDAKALQLAKELCGIDGEQQKSHRTDSRFN